MPDTNVKKAEIKKILILRFSSLGDIVMVTAMIRCLRKAYPESQIDMVVRGDFYDLIKYNPHLNAKIAFGRKAGLKGLFHLVKELNHRHYDLVYDVHRSLRTRLMLPLIRSRHKVTLTKPYVRRFFAMTFKWKSLIAKEGRLLERCIQPLHRFGVAYDGLGPEVFYTPQELITANQKKEITDLKEGQWRIGLIPSAQWPGKRWKPEYFREVLAGLIESTPHQFILFGGPNDDFCQQIAEGFSAERVVNAQGVWSIAEAAAVLKTCRFVVANDTGIMHVADAVGIPSILIFGPTSREMGCLPFHPDCVILEHSLWCRPCSKNGQAPCIRKKRWCLELTTPAHVLAAAKALMAKP